MRRRARITFVVGLTLAAYLGIQPHASAAVQVVALVDRSPFYCALDAGALQRCAAEFLRTLRANAERAYVTDQGLTATEAEIEAVFDYDRAFRRHDREQRARKLAELDERLAALQDDTPERMRLEAFRAVLARLARYDADVDAGIEAAMSIPREAAAGWIEQAKLDADLHRRFGGVVGVHAAGLYAHGARIELVKQYVALHDVAFREPDFAAAFERLLAVPPAIAYAGNSPDFTPFWLRPIAPSYMPH